MATCLEICRVGNNVKKSHDLLEFMSGRPLGGGYDENSGRP